MKVTISRTKQWNGRFREIELYTNKRKIGYIASGETKEFDIDKDTEHIYAKIDWCKSKSMLLKEVNKPMNLTLKSYKNGSLYLFITLLLVLSYYILSNAYNINLYFLLWIAGLLFIYPLYKISFGRNNYLKLEHQNT